MYINHRTLAVCAKRGHETSFQIFPQFVREKEHCCLSFQVFNYTYISTYLYSDNCNILMLFDLNGKHEGDPLIVAGIWGVISALHPVKVHNTLYVSLNRFIITEAVMWGNIYHKTHVTFRYVGTSVE